jgi:hypothetical protein
VEGRPQKSGFEAATTTTDRNEEKKNPTFKVGGYCGYTRWR